MAGISERLTRWSDPVFGELFWDERNLVWETQVEFRGHSVRLHLDPGLRNPTTHDQLAVIEPSRKLFESFKAAEPRLRSDAAREASSAVVEQQSKVTFSEIEFADDLVLDRISLHDGGELHYRSPLCFPGHVVTVYFEKDLAYGGVEIYELRTPDKPGMTPGMDA